MNTPSQSDNNRKVIFLFGPTAVGKTQLLCDCFSDFSEVVNADSVQVYKHLDIGSAKADSSTIKKIPHHLIDILEPWENYNVANFIHLADEACANIWRRDKIPVVSGGTAFYFKHFLYGLSLAPKSDPSVREEIANYVKNVGLQEAHKYLCTVDPVSGQKINPNDGYRISRALEVYKSSGKPLSSFALPNTPRNDMKVLSIGLCRDKEELRERIGLRVKIMFEQGMLSEMRGLLEMGANPSWQSMQGIGYKEFLNHVWKGNKDSSLKAFDSLLVQEIEEISNEIVMNSIHYAKRQMTFFRSFSNVHWIDPQNIDVVRSMVETDESFCS